MSHLTPMGTPYLAGCPALSIMSIYTGSSSTADGPADLRGGSPPYAWGSRCSLAPGHEPGLQRARCARSSQAPPALDAPTQGLASSWWSAAWPRRHRGGVRSCRSVDICSRHCACRQGTLAPGRAGIGWRIPWGLGTPRPLPGRSGVLLDWSFTGRAVCRGSGRCGRRPMAGEAARVGAAREPLPWPASGRCCSSALKGYAR